MALLVSQVASGGARGRAEQARHKEHFASVQRRQQVLKAAQEQSAADALVRAQQKREGQFLAREGVKQLGLGSGGGTVDCDLGPPCTGDEEEEEYEEEEVRDGDEGAAGDGSDAGAADDE